MAGVAERLFDNTFPRHVLGLLNFFDSDDVSRGDIVERYPDLEIQHIGTTEDGQHLTTLDVVQGLQQQFSQAESPEDLLKVAKTLNELASNEATRNMLPASFWAEASTVMTVASNIAENPETKLNLQLTATTTMSASSQMVGGAAEQFAATGKEALLDSIKNDPELKTALANWENLSKEERLEAYQDITNAMSEAYDLPNITVREGAQKGNLMEFDTKNQTINVSQQALANGNVEEMLAGIFEENMHHAQYRLVEEHLSGNLQPGTSEYALASAYTANIFTYQGSMDGANFGEGFMNALLYFSQPLEQFAKEFARDVTDDTKEIIDQKNGQQFSSMSQEINQALAGLKQDLSLTHVANEESGKLVSQQGSGIERNNDIVLS